MQSQIQMQVSNICFSDVKFGLTMVKNKMFFTTWHVSLHLFKGNPCNLLLMESLGSWAYSVCFTTHKMCELDKSTQLHIEQTDSVINAEK
jgi:hypothetical protein